MGNVEKLVSKQIWLHNNRQRTEQPARKRCAVRIGGVDYGPCLLLSRERGSGGDRLAHLVSERLGWPVFDREIVEEISQRGHLWRQLIESVDERVRSTWMDDSRTPLQATYLHYLRQVVLALGHQGEVVIIGRGAQYILPPACALRVRVVSPPELRVRRLAAHNGVPSQQAQRDLQKMDAERAVFIRSTFSHDVSSTLNYDLVVNTGDITVEAAADIVLAALHEKLGVQTTRLTGASEQQVA